MGEKILSLRNITKSFLGVNALKDVNLSIDQSQICCLVGENGCGKSTLIKIIAGVHTPDAGEIFLNGKHYDRLRPLDSIKEGIQIIYQDFSVFPNLSVAENIALNYQLASDKSWVNWKEVYKIARQALERIKVHIELDAKVEELSVANKQLIAIARALLQNARLIIMDEPTTALTYKEVVTLFGIIKDLRQSGISTLFVSHKLNEVLEISDRISILRNGENVMEGETEDFDRQKLVYHMTGRQITESYRSSEKKSEKGSNLLQVSHLSRKGSFKDVSFQLSAGEILGITGLLGSGRTELAMALFGIQPADSGEIFIDNERAAIDSVQDAMEYKIGYVPEDRLTEGLFLTQSIGKNIIVSNIDQLLTKMKSIDGAKIKQQIHRWMGELNIITPSQGLPVQSLSGGNQQRVVIAKWLETNPRILILNGPTVGVDIGSKTDIHQIIKELAAQGMGVLIISDDIPELLQNCDRILLMKQGRVTEEFLGNEITENDLYQKLVGTVA